MPLPCSEMAKTNQRFRSLHRVMLEGPYSEEEAYAVACAKKLSVPTQAEMDAKKYWSTTVEGKAFVEAWENDEVPSFINDILAKPTKRQLKEQVMQGVAAAIR